MIRVVATYGRAGGSAEAKAHTSAVVEGIRNELEEMPPAPTIIAGDFNVDELELPIIAEMTEEDQSLDFGAVASWWGGQDKEKTCSART